VNPLRLIATAGLCTLSITSVAAAGQGGGGGSHGGGGAQASGAGHASSAAQTSSAHVTRYNNPRVLHYLEPGSAYAIAKYEGCGSTRIRPGCAPRQTLELQSLRDEGLRLRQADGGALTPEHRAELQSKLDAIRTQSK
jgi:hypothetical protein